MKKSLLENVSIFLLKKGFTVKNLLRNSFDILARDNEKIMLIKILEDANAISREYSQQMLNISSYLDATPIIISNKAGNELDNNIVYTRFNIITLNFDTFVNCFNNNFPIIKRTQAGLTASLDGKKLKKVREELGYSLNSLSKKVGVTTKMIVKYENQNSEVTLTRATKIYDLLGEKVFNKINIFSHPKKLQDYPVSELSQKYVNLGFEASDISKAPFDIIARKENELILTEVGDKVNPNVASLSRLLDAENLVIFDKKKPKDCVAVTKEEFMEFEKANELIKLLKEH